MSRSFVKGAQSELAEVCLKPRSVHPVVGGLSHTYGCCYLRKSMSLLLFCLCYVFLKRITKCDKRSSRIYWPLLIRHVLQACKFDLMFFFSLGFPGTWQNVFVLSPLSVDLCLGCGLKTVCHCNASPVAYMDLFLRQSFHLSPKLSATH